MNLIEFIENNHSTIITSWVEFAQTMQPWAKDLSLKDLEDHAEDLLMAIVNDMKMSQSKVQQSEKSKGQGPDRQLGKVGQRHAYGRLETGFSIVQLASEFRALRASILRKWEEAQGSESGDMTRLNEAIDEALTTSITAFSETVDNTREQFLAILGHDLRNPIGAIVMAASVLNKNQAADTAGIVNVILSSAKRMNRLVSDLLDLTRSRLGSGIPVNKKPMELGSLCQQIVKELQSAYPHHQLEFKSIGDLHGEWDSDRLAQVISNLAANALQHGSTVRPVSIVAQEQGQDVVLKVHNEGMPIPESAKKTIFEPMTRFQTGDPDEDKTIGGLGLGLFITKEIVTSHGGSISVESAEAQGTTFTVTLPCRPTPGTRQTVQPNA
ncbi:MAG TPA: sensor histidine kinase [Oligoflexus sp.]|uniref:sensor histidine kinase n=1 Tax=Oligoflexus sp. TaxID=1971216 RepID=UPI002D5703BD|nr:sensor histidine kinase [Oligoflexus sp.]HYX39559.1 sensor histidine kinase [Oligoflexus sp.]